MASNASLLLVCLLNQETSSSFDNQASAVWTNPHLASMASNASLLLVNLLNQETSSSFDNQALRRLD
ncbi:hypothetical protein KAT72_11825 [Aeromonas popoffii]|uniref:Uncharacterized protein n=1 Tax=Aeromonas popoffii TaxID=70856 RepID=A0ABS5GRF1_9GAMM|nr:hypothetical protein [Aeromonas popoffii]MBR7629693.1 hypothetical protein [Aeromonas popoffii]